MDPDESQFLTATAISRNGAITVQTTEYGFPIGIAVHPDELRRQPDELARNILRLCKQAADRARLARRNQLADTGVSDDILTTIGLPTAESVAHRELTDEQEYGMEPRSWLGRT